MRVGTDWHFTTGEGDVHIFADSESRVVRGHAVKLPGAFLELARKENRLIVTQWDVDYGEVQRFVFAAERVDDALTLVLAGIENACGDGIELTWGASGRMTRLRQRAEKRTIIVNYSEAGRIRSLALLADSGVQIELVRYEYNDAGCLSAAFDRRGLATRYEYDAHFRVSREILKDGAVYSYKYDEKGRCIHFSGLDHYNEKRLRFLDNARTTIVTNSYGKSSVYRYLPSGQIVSETDPTGNTQSTVFDEYNRIIARVDAIGATTRYSYDEDGNRDSVTDPLGNTYRFVFNAHHQAVSITNPLGKTWLREYDSQQRLVTSTNPANEQWTIGYDEVGNPSIITDPLGATRRLRFTNGLVTEMTDWMGNSTRFAWDEFGRVIERVGPVHDRTTVRYDPTGNPEEVELPDGGRLRATYDSGGNLSSFTNAKGHTSRLRYGPCGRLLEAVDPLGRAIRYLWGTEPKRLNAVINEKGEIFSYIHDDLGRVVRERSFDGREQAFDYDRRGHCVAFTNGNGETLRLKRDAAGQLVKATRADGEITSYEYDSVGKLVAGLNSDIPVWFEYDDAGRLIREIQGQDWVRTYYNAVGEVIRTQTSFDHEVRYELDPNSSVLKLVTGNNDTITFERDARGFETGRQMPGGLRLKQLFDSMGRLLEQRVNRTLDWRVTYSSPELRTAAGNEVVKRSYRYDPDGLVLSIKDGKWGSTAYAYDPAERLLNALRKEGLNEHFDFDATDNLTRIRQEGLTSVDDACIYGPGNRLLQRGDTRYEYDLDGRLVRKTEAASTGQPQVWLYSWDVLGQLKGLIRPDGTEWEYKYDAFGRRVAKLGPKSIRQFLWNGDVIIHERQDSGHPVAWITESRSFAPLAKVQDGKFFTLLNDHLGTPREMFDSSGDLVWAANWTAWGQIERKQHPLSKQDCPFRFQGQYFDDESQLHYNRFRYYDPENGRFIGPDPIGLAGGVNLYQYVHNPIAWVDVLGLTGDPAKATHITYEGVKDGKPYIGYASMPGLGRTPEEVLAYRYPNTDHFDVAPKAFYVGDGQAGKNTARGLEQRVFEDRGGLKGTSNKQNPVGENNPNRDTYLAAADEERAKTKKPCAQ
jgi:RHS repeat-associated protein